MTQTFEDFYEEQKRREDDKKAEGEKVNSYHDGRLRKNISNHQCSHHVVIQRPNDNKCNELWYNTIDEFTVV